MNKNIKCLGIEFGSTRIKTALIEAENANNIIATGSHTWENEFKDGFWTYNLNDVWSGLNNALANLNLNQDNNVNAIGISAMMHGYLAFDKDDNLLVPFRTWRNTNTEKAAEELTKLFGFNIPQRWSIAHLYQAILNNEEHVKEIDYITTLAGYVHWKLTGEKVIGIGDGSGMFPIENYNYNKRMAEQFLSLTGIDIFKIFPKVLNAGEYAGKLTESGAGLLNNIIKIDTPFCPPEGDAGTGMVATNAVRERTGNVSAGTSIFAMTVLEKPLKQVYSEIDMVTTPDGKPVAMVHCNNCCSDIDDWINLFAETGLNKNKDVKEELYNLFYGKALDSSADFDCGGLLSYNYFGGEPITGLIEGRPLFVRLPNSKFNLANFCRCLLYSALSTLKIGMDILTSESEGVILERICGHGGLYKTTQAGQILTAAALNVDVTVTKQAAEGGAWGMAILAAYYLCGGRACSSREVGASPALTITLADYLDKYIFNNSANNSTVKPNEKDVKGFNDYLQKYKAGLAIEKEAIKCLTN